VAWLPERMSNLRGTKPGSGSATREEGFGQRDEGGVDGQADSPPVRRQDVEFAACTLGREGLHRFQFDVLREDLDRGGVDRAQLFRELVALGAFGDGAGQVHGVAHQQGREIDGQGAAAPGLSDHLQHRYGAEREAGARALRHARIAAGAIARILEDDRDFPADLTEGEDLGVALHAPVDADRRGAERGLDRLREEIAAGHALGIRGGQGEQHFAFRCIDLHRQQCPVRRGGRRDRSCPCSRGQGGHAGDQGGTGGEIGLHAGDERHRNSSPWQAFGGTLDPHFADAAKPSANPAQLPRTYRARMSCS